MSRYFFLLALLFTSTLVGCSGPANEVEDEKGRKYSVHAKSPLTVTQAEFTKFSVSVSRTKWKDDITVKFTQVPKGLSIDEKEWVSKDGENEHIFKLMAEAEAELQTEAELVIEASSGTESATKTVKVKILESLENKIAKKKQFLKEKGAELESLKTQLDVVQKKLPDIDDLTVKKELSKELTEAYEELEDAGKAHKDLEAAPPEHWERHRNDLSSQLADLQSQVEAVQGQLKAGLKTKEKEKS